MYADSFSSSCRFTSNRGLSTIVERIQPRGSTVCLVPKRQPKIVGKSWPQEFKSTLVPILA